MTEHLPIQDPDDYSPADMMGMSAELFSPLTPVARLEAICMTLAHLPTEDAQGLLARFKDSPRAQEVTWLDCAVEEGTYHWIEPRNPLEEREYLTLKVIQELIDEVFELESEHDRLQVKHDKLEIRAEALEALASRDLVRPEDATAARRAVDPEFDRIEALDNEIAVKTLMIEHLRGGITTPRYRTLDPEFMRHVQWDD